ncbi:MAG: hypothetical protein WAQ98_21255 [Blastocatellia bacterium]
MQEILTMAEIKQLYPSGWVLIEEIETDKELNIKSGKVTYHSDNKQEVWLKARERKPKRFSVFYTGEIPKNIIFLI